MKLKFIHCPACNGSVPLGDLESGRYICPHCGHASFYTPEEVPASETEGANSHMQGLQYTVDIVMVIDTTASMKHIIDEVKSNALRFYDDLKSTMEAKSKIIDQLRVKVISFRDFWADGKRALEVSPFYTLPGQRTEFSAFVSALRASGGGDYPENGLEALTFAMKADWAVNGDKKRHIIVLWTDADTHALEKAKADPPRYYPEGMPKDLNELTDLWEDNAILTPSTKRIILFAPDKPAWSDISAYWSNTIQYPSAAGKGLNELDYQTILDAIGNSV